MDKPEKIIASVIAELYASPAAPELRQKAAREIVAALDIAGWEIVRREPDDANRSGFDAVRRATEGR